MTAASATRKALTRVTAFLLVCPLAATAAPADPVQPIAAPTPARPAYPPSSKGTLPEVTIEANREALEKRVRAFVGRLTHSRRFPDNDQPAPRWVQPLCFAVAGLPRRYAEFVAARLVQIAISVGADVRKECSRLDANFEVIFTPNPTETLRYLDHHPLLLQDTQQTGLPLIERFLNPPKSVVVRVWHNTEFLNRSGDACGFSLLAGGVISCSDSMGGSRLTLLGVAGFTRALVVIDSMRIEGIELEQISAYVALVGLVDVDDDVNLGDTPSILRLFADPPEKRADGLTKWDRAFLSGFYRTDWRNSQQRMQIGDKMVGEIAH